MSVRCWMSYKPIQRDELHETSAGRLVAYWFGIGFPMLHFFCCCRWLPGCYRLTVSNSMLWSVISNQCLANDTVGLLLTRPARNCCWLKPGLWLEKTGWSLWQPTAKSMGMFWTHSLDREFRDISWNVWLLALQRGPSTALLHTR